MMTNNEKSMIVNIVKALIAQGKNYDALIKLTSDPILKEKIIDQETEYTRLLSEIMETMRKEWLPDEKS